MLLPAVCGSPWWREGGCVLPDGSCMVLRNGENGWDGATLTVTTGELVADRV